MPRSVKQFAPPWVVKHDRERKTAAQRGYCSPAWARIRKAVIARDAGVCQECQKAVSMNAGDAHVDHKIPKEQGGTDALENLQLLCRSCHSKKTAKENPQWHTN